MDSNLVLLDTCAVIWLATGASVSKDALVAIDAAVQARRLLVSPASAWEVGLLARRGRGPSTFLPDADAWFAQFLEKPGLTVSPLTPQIAIAASHLPGEFHNDPADRFIVATARARGAVVVTRDRAILDYAAAGHVRALAC